MKIFRHFDYFRKSTSPEAIKSTCIGGFVSLACVVSIFCLVYSELSVLFTPEYKKNVTVSSDPSKHPHLRINLNIVFPNLPCPMVMVMVQT